MPRKSDSIPIKNEKLDRRVKLTTGDKIMIAFEYKSTETSQQKLADKYGVSKRTIQFILHPEKLEENKKQRLARGGWKQYYDKEAHSQAIKEHRDYKKELYKNGKIK